MPVSVLRFRPGLVLPPRVYLDTNFLLDARDELSPKYQPASLCLRELLQQRAELNVSALVFDELWWGLFKLSYRLLTGQELTGRMRSSNGAGSMSWKRRQWISCGPPAV